MTARPLNEIEKANISGEVTSMPDSADDIPKQFDEAFLDWFRARTETYWAALPSLTPEEALTKYVTAGVGGGEFQHGTRWLNGLSEDEIGTIERRWNLTFPLDYRRFLRHLHSVDRPAWDVRYTGESVDARFAKTALATAYVEKHDQHMILQNGPSFYNWQTGGDAIKARFARPWEGLQFDVEHSNLWLKSWGEAPAMLMARQERVRELVEAAPRLIPIFGHRYLLANGCAAEHPVLSVYGADIIVYGLDLRDYFLAEFHEMLGFSRIEISKVRASAREYAKQHRADFTAIPFWGEMLSI
jgi:hypothetical protein